MATPPYAAIGQEQGDVSSQHRGSFCTPVSRPIKQVDDQSELGVFGEENSQTSSHAADDPMDITHMDVKRSTSSEGTSESVFLKPDVLVDVILNKSAVPVSLAAVCVLGLPHSRKSTMFETMFVNEIHLKYDEEITKFHVRDRINSGTDRGAGLSMYLLSVLGGLMQGKIAWGLPQSPHRSEIMFAILSSIIRYLNSERLSHDCMHVDTDALARERESGNENYFAGHEDLMKHFEVVFKEALKTWGDLKNDQEKIESLANGFSLINIFDVGFNRAVYDLLPFIANYCDNLVRLVFFDVERDAEHLQDPPELDYKKYNESMPSREDATHLMQSRPRLEYLMHFASIGYQPGLPETEGDTVFIGSWSQEASSKRELNEPSEPFTNVKKMILQETDKFKLSWIDENKYWVELQLKSSHLHERGRLVEEIITNRSENKCSVPVKWIFLRSFLSSSHFCHVIVTVQYIRNIALHRFKMNDEQFKEFLKTFKVYGSLLHFHDFHNINQYVIVDTQRFAEMLSKLYYPDDTIKYDSKDGYSLNLHKKYGLVFQAGISKLIGVDSTNEFMEIIEDLGLVAEISSRRIIPEDELKYADDQTQQKKCYYIPLARTGALIKPDRDPQYTSLYIRVRSAQFPANIQASMAKAMIKEAEMSLIACKDANVSQFESRNGDIRVKFIYFGEITEIITMHHRDDSGDIEQVKILNACCSVFTQRSQKIREFVSINFGFRCRNNPDEIHNLPLCFDSPLFCTSSDCFQFYEQSDTLQPWITAAKKSDLLRIHNFSNGVKEGTRISLEDIVSNAQKLISDDSAVNNERIVESFAKSSQISQDQLKKLMEEQPDKLKDSYAQLVVKLIFLWQQKERQAKKVLYKEQLQFIVDNVLIAQAAAD